MTNNWYFYRWHPAIALRYLPFVDEIQLIDKDASVLEVGSSGLGIAPYLKRQVTGADVTFPPPHHPLLKQVVASATKLPFKNDTFDVVLSVDMFEHLQKPERAQAIQEMMRVAQKKVLIGVPCGRNAHEQDKKLDEYYQKKYGKRFHFYEEQVEYGLPEKHEMMEMIEKAAQKYRKKIDVRTEGNENLKTHEFLMKGWMSKNLLANIFYRKILLFAIPILRRYNQEPTYRQMFYVDIGI